MKKVVLLFINFFITSPVILFAHGGADPAPPTSATAKNYFTLSKVSSQFEAVLRYTPLEAGKSAGLKLFLCDFETNRAVDSAIISVTSSEDANLKFTVYQSEKGQYDIDVTFPEKKNYSLIVNIKSGDKNDLLLISPIEVGKQLPVEADESANTKKTLNWIWLIAAFIAGGFLVYLFTSGRHKKISKAEKISIIIFLILLSIPVNIKNVSAHENPAFASKGNLTDEFEIGKETQFLFNVLTVKPAFSNYSAGLQLNGVIKPSTNGYAQIVSPHNGKIISLNVSIGQHVSKGQIVAAIEQTQSSAEQISLSTEKANADAEFQAAKQEYERLQSLKDIVSEKDLQNAEIRYNNAVTNKESYKQLSGDLSLTYALHSPIDGVVDNFNLTVGQQVEQSEMMMNIFNTKKVNIEASVFSSDLSKITDDAVFSIQSSDEKSPSVQAKMISINQSYNMINQASTLILQIDNNTQFLPGQAVHIHMMKKSDRQVMTVAGSAISTVNGKPAVFIHQQPETFKIVYVETGEENMNGIEILKGLNAEDRVIMNGTYEVKSIFQSQ